MELIVKQEITDIFRNMGIPAHLSGYEYARYMIERLIDEPMLIKAVTIKLYPDAAAKYNTTRTRVERATRTAVETAFDRGDLETLQLYFGNTMSSYRGKPTNSEFMATIADNIRLRREAMSK
ncbi:MAG: sporulation initiation factor Spo0A C-terminal domain-containing protein [Oscillospiraceae bacterium]|jgi:two-component system response regulator (stage 0 sporulation protein A)|nr:sporulation initiation factor Spo0A C-terminal domain-containing protein [Oscillospiraceae bacterium]